MKNWIKTSIFFFLLTFLNNVSAQININVKLNPPFTPFIADYTTPARLQDISVSLFNSTNTEQQLKFKFSLTNKAKGISIALKENINPTFPLVLAPNEFKILSLDDVSRMYQGLTQNNLDIQGVNIQQTILDGILPDGFYEFCITGFDFNSPGFSIPLTGNYPSGCAGFNIIYPDPPTDIRLNNQFLNYRYGQNIPIINHQFSNFQAHTIQFTPPNFNIEGNYEYELLIYEEQVLNPLNLSESKTREAVSSLQPYIFKTSNLPIFFIDQSDMQLMKNENYYLFIKVKDLNQKTIFKNGGLSTIQAFKFKDVSIKNINAPILSNSVCGRDSLNPDSILRLNIALQDFNNQLDAHFYKNLEIKVLVKRFFKGVTPPNNIFNSPNGIVVIDSTYKNIGDSFRLSEIIIKNLKKSGDTAHFNKLFVSSIQLKLVGSETPFYNFLNNGFCIQNCLIYTGNDPKLKHSNVPAPLLTKINFNISYPANGDTLPFMYPPVVVNYEPKDTQHVALFTHYNASNEPTHTNSIFLLNPKSNIANQVLSLNIDTTYKLVETKFKQSSLIDNSGGDGSAILQEAINLLKQNQNLVNNRIINRNPQFLVMGGDINAKVAISRTLLNYGAQKQLSGLEQDLVLPQFLKVINVLPYRNINWNMNVGVYTNKSYQAIPFLDYSNSFLNNSLTSSYPNNRLVTNGYVQLEGQVNVGMKTPIISNYNQRRFKQGNVTLTFVPSARPAKLFPDNLDAAQWREHGLLNIAQQYNIEISKSPSFDSIYQVLSQRIIKTYTFPLQKDEIVRDLYEATEKRIRITDVGKYYWRVTWSNITADTISGSTRSYFENLGNLLASSQILGEDIDVNFDDIFFKRNNYKISRTDSFEVYQDTSSNNCNMACEFSLTEQPQSPITNQIVVGDVLSIGKFKLKVTQIAFLGNRATGKGTISVPYLKAPIKVLFTNLEINQSKRVIAGNAQSEPGNRDVLSELMPDLPYNANTPIYDFLTAQIKANPTSSSIYDRINEWTNVIGAFTSDDPINLPLAISTPLFNQDYRIVFTDIKFTAERTFVNVLMVANIPIPERDNFILGFGAKDLCMNPEGISVESSGRLSLLNDIDIPFGDSLILSLKGEKNKSNQNNTIFSKVAWDCNGFKNFELTGEVTMPKNWMTKVNQEGTILDGNLKGTFSTTIQSIEQFKVELGFNSPFQFTFLNDWIFNIQSATLDFSDLSNPVNMIFPRNYSLNKQNNLWRGIHISQVGVTLPKVFNNNGNRIGFNANNILIDETGVSFGVNVLNIINATNGRLSSWKFGIDTIKLDVVSNRFSSASMSGKFGIPLLGSEINYQMLISEPLLNQTQNNYQFSIKPSGDITIPLWLANINLNNSSSVRLESQGRSLNQAALIADLSGSISLGSSTLAGVKDVRLGVLPFEHLVLATSLSKLDSFSITLATLGGVNMNRGFESNNNQNNSNNTPIVSNPEPQKFGGFPIGIRNFSFDEFSGKKCLFELGDIPIENKRIGIKFNVYFSIAESQNNQSNTENGIGGNTTLGIYGVGDIQKLVSEKKLDFKLAGINIDTIRVNAQLSGAVSIEGAIAFMGNDPVFGNGIAGFVRVQVPPAFELTASVMFGEVNQMRYWMVDIKLNFAPIPIDFSINVIHANSFGGGAWYKMRREQTNGTGLGYSSSGGRFIPDQTKLFGFEARLGLTGPASQGIFGEVRFRMEFGATGSIDNAGLDGDLWFIDRDFTKSPVMFKGNITMNFRESKLNASLKSFVNIMPGDLPSVVKGNKIGGAANEMGGVELDIDFNRGQWKIFAGTPSSPNSLGFFIGNNLVFQSSSYMMMGNDVPPPAALPQTVVDAFKEANKSIPQQPRMVSNSRENQTKFVVGVQTTIPNKNFNVGPFYASLGGTLGFDAQLANMAAPCPSGKNGIAGMYAQGTAYMRIGFAMGMSIESPIYSGNLIVAEGVAAGVLTAGIANPYYFEGSFIASYSALGGFVEGVKDFNFKYAEDPNCSPSTKSNVNFGQLIADISPKIGEENVSLGVEPNVLLNFKLNEPTEYEVINPNYKSNVSGSKRTLKRSFKLGYEYFVLELRNGNSWINVPGEISIIQDNFNIKITPNSFLQPTKLYRIRTKIFVDTLNVADGRYYKMQKRNRNVDTTITFSFVTEQEPNVFSTSQLIKTTPFEGQQYFMKSDQITGEILFRSSGISSSYFLSQSIINGKDYDNKYKIELKPLDGGETFTVVPSILTNKLSFTIPTNLPNKKKFVLSVIKTRTQMRTIAGRRIPFSNLGFQFETLGDGIKVKKSTTSGFSQEVFVMFSYVFGTSKYNTFKDKIQDVSIKSSVYSMTKNSAVNLTLLSEEPFEEYELLGFRQYHNQIFTNPVFSYFMSRDQPNNFYSSQFENKIRTPYNALYQNLYNTSNNMTNFSQNRGLSLLYSPDLKAPLSPIIQNYDFRLASSIVSSYFNNTVNCHVCGNNVNFSGQNSSPITYELNLSFNDLITVESEFLRLKAFANTIKPRPSSGCSNSGVLNPLYCFNLINSNKTLVDNILNSSYNYVLPSIGVPFKIVLYSRTLGNEPLFNASIPSKNSNYKTFIFYRR